MSSYLSICEKAARAAGDVLNKWRGKFNVREKGRADLVTEADLEAQRVIESILGQEHPDFGFLGEEATGKPRQRSGNSPYRWIVDPLDGTTNYVHGLPHYSVSIALENAGQIVCGVVYDPVFDRLYKAEKGRGAWLNEQPLSVSTSETLEESVVAASFAANVEEDSPEITQFVRVLTRCRGIRRFGSAALNLAYVAAGQLDGYYASSVQIWDVAAGIVLVEEAGGVVRGYSMRPFDVDQPTVVATSTMPLQEAVQAQIG